MLENERKGLFGDSPGTFRKISLGSGPPSAPAVGSRSRQTSDTAPILEEKEGGNGDDDVKEKRDGKATEGPVENGSGM